MSMERLIASRFRRPGAATRRPVAAPRRPIPTSLMALGAIVVGTVLGLCVTDAVLVRRFDPATVRVGPWMLWPKSGTVNVDPYARAILAQSGQIPVAAAEGVLALATHDDAWAGLSGLCSYQVVGNSLQARLWSLSVTRPDGRVAPNPIDRYGFTSSELVRRSDGTFTIELAATARSGNWLPVPSGSFGLALHLYDSPLGSATSELDVAHWPRIERQGCAP